MLQQEGGIEITLEMLTVLLAFPEYNGKKQPRSARAGLRFYSLTTALYSEKLSLPFLSAA